jgi:hypothetical protein
MVKPIALFKETFLCQKIKQSVLISGTKLHLYANGELASSLIIDAECSGEIFCKLNLKSNSCPKKTNLNESLS